MVPNAVTNYFFQKYFIALFNIKKLSKLYYICINWLQYKKNRDDFLNNFFLAKNYKVVQQSY